MSILEPGERAPAPDFLGTTAQRAGVWADGSCLFHALAAAAARGRSQPRAAGLALRKSIYDRATPGRYAQAMRAYGVPEEGRLGFRAFKKKLRAGASDMHTIPYIMYDLDLNVLFAENHGFYCGVQYFHPERRNVIIYWYKEHFEPIGGIMPASSTAMLKSLYSRCRMGFYRRLLLMAQEQ